MAKIKDLKFELAGKECKEPLNCNVKGEFSTALPLEISNALNLNRVIRGSTIESVQTSFYDAIHLYKNSKTTYSLFILIEYKASGFYRQSETGSFLFDQFSKFNYGNSYNSLPVIAFDFDLAIKKTVAGQESWFKASPYEKKYHREDEPIIDGYVCGSWLHSINNFKIIPFSQAAFETLQKGRGNLRKISEMLYEFINQDEALLVASLTSGKLLN